MPDQSNPRETFRSFTVRVPLSLYIELTNLAQADETNINTKVNTLLKLGIGHHVQLNDTLSRMLKSALLEGTDNEQK